MLFGPIANGPGMVQEYLFMVSQPNLSAKSARAIGRIELIWETSPLESVDAVSFMATVIEGYRLLTANIRFCRFISFIHTV